MNLIMMYISIPNIKLELLDINQNNILEFILYYYYIINYNKSIIHFILVKYFLMAYHLFI